MDPVFKKLNYKNQAEICVLNAPESFNTNLAAMQELTLIKSALDSVQKLQFGLVFVTKQAEVDFYATALAEKLEGDGQLWFAYPKRSSKRYKCEFNRDNGWAVLGNLGFEGVRMVAIDEDWSALRFRRAEYVKNMTRSFALSAEGKARSKQ